jgi:hypothetical protein
MHRECGLKLPSKIALVVFDVRAEERERDALAVSAELKIGEVAR